MDLVEWEKRVLLTEESVRRVGDCRGTEMVAAMAIVAASYGGGYWTLPLSQSRFDFILRRQVK